MLMSYLNGKMQGFPRSPTVLQGTKKFLGINGDGLFYIFQYE